MVVSVSAFLSLDPTDPAHAAILAPLGGSPFVPAGHQEHDRLRSVARELGFLDEAG